MTLTYEGFIPELLREVPEFTPLYEEHRADNLGEILPYVLIDDFYRFLAAADQKTVPGGPTSDQWQGIVDRSIRLLDRAIGGSDSVLRELVFSFLENVNSQEPGYQTIKPMLCKGLNLRNAIEEYYSNYG